MTMPPVSPWLLDQEIKTLADERKRCAEADVQNTNNYERIARRTVELLMQRLPTVPPGLFLGPGQFQTAGGDSGGGITPEYVLPLDVFQLDSSIPSIGFVLDAGGNHGFARIEYNDSGLAVSSYLLDPQPTALNLDLQKLYGFLRAAEIAEEETRNIPLERILIV